MIRAQAPSMMRKNRKHPFRTLFVALVPAIAWAPISTSRVAHAEAPSASASTSVSPSSAASTSPSTAPLVAIESPSKPVIELTRCLALADARNPTLRMAADRLVQAHAQLDEIKWIPWGQFAVSGGVAAVPEIGGTSVYSANGDISLSSHMGPAFQLGVSGALPLYTFGKISASQAAGEALVDVALHDIDKFRLLVHHDVRRAYFGIQLARDARYMLKQAGNKLDGAISSLAEGPDADEVELLRMKTYRAEITARLSEADKQERIATASLAFLVGESAGIDVPDEPISGPRKPLSDDIVYLAAARTHRPELAMVRAGVDLRRHQVELARAKLMPDIGLGLSFGYSTAPIIADQTNPFVYDGGNYLRYGAGIVFRWNLDLMAGGARVQFAEAQLQEMKDQETYALGGVGVEVESAYATAKDASAREKSYGEAEHLAKRWVAAISTAIELGTREERELIEPLRAFLTNRFAHLQAIMDLDVAISSLTVATGDEAFADY
ncbi:MAG: TolC family protein [Polyangiales bacterium]